MTRPLARWAAAVAAAVVLAGCGVRAQRDPEPLPASVPVMTPPSITQEPALPAPVPTGSTSRPVPAPPPGWIGAGG